MYRLFSLAVLLCVACGDKTDPPTDTQGPATLVVHSNWWDFVDDLGEMQGITVLLGDGSRHSQPLGRDGIARFHDPTITGPQDITVVMVGTNKVVASTTLAVEGTEVWIRSDLAHLTSLPSTRQATLSGRVTGQDSTPTQVRVVGQGFNGVTTVATDGTFSLDVRGDTSGQVALLAIREHGPAMAVGMLRDIPVGEGRSVNGLVIPLDHPVNERRRVVVTNVGSNPSMHAVSAAFMLGSEFLFSTSTAGLMPFNVPAMARTSPFDTVEARVSALAGHSEWLHSGLLTASTPMVHDGVTSLALPSPMRLTSPSPGTEYAPGSERRSGLTLSWTADPAAHVVTVQLTPHPDEPGLSWYVTAPASVSSFTPFPLPAKVVSSPREPRAGRYSVLWSSRFLGTGLGYPELFKESPALNTPDAWRTNTYGSVILRD
ncbi:hypothetical protein OV207_19595 [Corallococcus sp. BB11-1]|uniref:hypothetical protein n=1 Tax=Corallococcus sp. BB11-1 TaxID=2996783 RepID=UPI002271C926|nr:hypothetical protein [Corallococcus sp. BB11-1]MCY1033664.1 hypothetical protein [Corallococcus sp. BB11-1]